MISIFKNLLLLLLLFATSVKADVFQCVAYGQNVKQIPVDYSVLAAMGVGGGVAIQHRGIPITLYDRDLVYASAEFLNHILAHECAHHQLGHNNMPDLNTDEHHADCRGVYLLQKQLDYGTEEMTVIYGYIKRTVPFGKQRTEEITSCRSMEAINDGTEIARR